jgi:hypothetical protein
MFAGEKGKVKPKKRNGKTKSVWDLLGEARSLVAIRKSNLKKFKPAPTSRSSNGDEPATTPCYLALSFLEYIVPS